MENLQLTLSIHALITWMLIGMMWFIQIIHFPLYSNIKKGFHEYEKCHLKRAGYLIGPLMLIEAITAIFLIGLSTSMAFSVLAALNLIFLVFVWILTFLFEVSEQQKLSIKFSKKMHHKLLRTNWWRTIFWSIRGILVLLLFYIFKG